MSCEDDIYVDMPPKRRYPVQLNIRKVRKGKPIIVIPEGIE